MSKEKSNTADFQKLKKSGFRAVSYKVKRGEKVVSGKEGFSKKGSAYNHLLAGMSLNNGNYIIEKILGEGGFGVTYMAKDTNLLSTVAIKEYRQQSADYDSEKFLREAQILSSLNNIEGIVNVHNFFRENGTAYIVMDYVEGISIREYVNRNGKIPLDKVLEMMRKPIIALRMVNEHGLIHRDISADNIMVSSNAKLTIIDFGAARYSNITNTEERTALCKAGFSALEQYSSKGCQGAWTDVYSICATMYFMMTGKTPVSVTDRVLEECLVPLSDKDGADAYIAKIIGKGMEIDHKYRIQNMESLYEQLYKEPFPEMSADFFDGISAKVPEENKIKSGILSKTHLARELIELENERMKNKKSFIVKITAAVIICLFVISGLFFMQSAEIKNNKNDSVANPSATEQAFGGVEEATQKNTTGKTQKQAEESTQKPAKEPSQQQTKEPTQKPAQEPKKNQTKEPVQKPAKEPTKSPSSTSDSKQEKSDVDDEMIPLPEDYDNLAGSLDDL